MNTPLREVNRDSTNIDVIMEIAMLVFSFLPPALVFLFKKDDTFLLEQSKESLNASISILLTVFLASHIPVITLISLITLLAAYAYALFVCVKAAIENSNSQIYQFPTSCG